MPIFDYACPDCGARVELLVRTAAAGVPACPDCGGTRLDKLPSAGHMVGSRFSAPATCCGREEGCDTAGCGDRGSCCCGN